ncbi:MAG: FadR/GntR family transcriptional regulator [Roseburia sp.]
MKDREYKRVMAFVKDGIRSGEFRVGSKLPTEREMAETLGMSRPSIREALKSMENIGLIESQQGSGNYICCNMEKSLSEVINMMLLLQQIDKDELAEARCLLEHAIGLLAAKNMGKQDFAELKALAESMQNADQQRSYEIDREFHQKLILGSGNRFMITIMQVFSEIYKESIRKGWENADAEKFEKMWKLHVEIAEAIETGDQKKSMLPYRHIMILFISKMMVKKSGRKEASQVCLSELGSFFLPDFGEHRDNCGNLQSMFPMVTRVAERASTSKISPTYMV